MPKSTCSHDFKNYFPKPTSMLQWTIIVPSLEKSVLLKKILREAF